MLKAVITIGIPFDDDKYCLGQLGAFKEAQKEADRIAGMLADTIRDLNPDFSDELITVSVYNV